MDNDNTAIAGPASEGLRRLILPGLFAFAKILMHLPFLSRYGYYHDELYFLACGFHPAFGYVDHPPFVPMVARLADTLFGQSLFGLRIFGVIAGAAAVFLTGVLVRRLGGGRFAAAVACASVLVAPVFVRAATMLDIPVFEPVIWISCAYFLVRLAQGDRPSLWIWIGLILGCGLMIKHSTLFLALGIGLGVLLTPLRAHLKTRWPYLAVLVAAAIFLPNIVWQIQNGWPTLKFLVALNKTTMGRISLPEFLFGQWFYLGPLSAPVWIIGLVFFLGRSGGKYRILGIVFITAAVLLLVLKSKIYYLSPAYPALFAGGGVALERFVVKRRAAWLKPVALGVLGLSLALFAPILLPFSSVKDMDRLTTALTMGMFKGSSEVTDLWHGMIGWEERVQTVAKIYNALPREERETTAIFADWYGPAGAIDYFGGEYGLPKAISTHMTYYLWGPPRKRITTVIYAGGGSAQQLRSWFGSVNNAARIYQADANPWEKTFNVVLCRQPKKNFQQIWWELKSSGY